MVQRTVNLRVLIVTVIAGGLLLGGIYFLHEWQVTRTAKGLKVLADAQEQKSEWQKAAGYLDRYLRLKPQDAAAASRLALTYARGAEFPTEKQRAVTLHYRALAAEQVEQEWELRSGLAALLLELGRFAEAENVARNLVSTRPDDPEACRVLALALARQRADGSLAKADLKALGILRAIEKARQLNPADVKVAAALASAYREWPDVVAAEYPQQTAIDREQRADATIDQLVRDSPQEGPIFLARYLYRTKYGRPDASRDLDEAVRLAPDNVEVLLTAGLQALEEAQRLGRDPTSAAAAKPIVEKAKAFLERLVAVPADQRPPAAYVSLGDCLLAMSEGDSALKVWRDGLKQYRQPTVQITFHAKIAETLLNTSRADAAKEPLDQIDTLVKNLGTSVPRDYKLAIDRERELRLAKWHMQRGELGDAIPKLRSVILRQPQGDTRIEATLQSWLLLGAIQFSLGESRDAATAYDEAAKLAPTMQQTRLVAARAYLMAGQPRLAAERAEQALAIAKTGDAWLTLASAEFQQQVSLPLADRNWNRFQQAMQTLEQEKSQLGDNAPWRIDFLRIDYLMAEARAAGRPDEGIAQATQVLKGAEAAHASHKAFWLQVCLAYQNLGATADADRSLGELRRAGASAAELAVVGARLASLRQDQTGAERILEDAAKSVSVQEHQALRAELLRVALASKDLPKVRSILMEDHRRQPKDLSVIRRLAELDLDERNLPAVAEWARKAEQEGGVPGQVLAQYLQAWRMYLDPAAKPEERLTKAMHELEQVVLARPNWAEAAALKGLVALRLGRTTEAVTDLERAVSLGDRRLFVYEQLIGLLESLNRWSDVELYLSRLEGELPKTQRLAELASVQELRQEQPQNAVEIARQSVAQRPNDPLAHLWLGRMLMLVNDADEAEQCLERAVALAPTDPRVWSGLLGLHARTKDRTKSEQVLTRLAQNAKLDPTQRSFLLAQGYEMLGQHEAAKRQYGDVASRSPQDLGVQLRIAEFYLKSDPQEAERILRKALQIDKTSTTAKRMLAVALASQGEKGLEEAQTLLSEAGADGTIAQEDQRIRALLLVQQGGVTNLERAAKIMEGLVENKLAPAASDRQFLAQLYERQAQVIDDGALETEKWKAAERQLELAADGDSVPPASIAAVIQFLARHDRKDEAAVWLDKLEAAVERLPKQSPDMVALVTQMQVLVGATERSEKWLALLENDETNGLRPLALRVQIEVQRNAETDVESLIEPRAAELLAATSRMTEQAPLFTGIGDLYTSLKKYPQAERWYRKLIAVAPDQYPLLVGALARQGRLAEAIAQCEEAAKIDATSRPAMVLAAALTESSPKEQDFKQAEPLLSAAIAKFPSDVGLLYAATLVRLMQGKHDDAAALYRKILAANPRFVPALNNLAMLLAEQPAQQLEALRLIDKAIEIVGKDPGLMDTKGAILVYSGKSAEAVPLLVSATRDDNADPRHHFHLAVAYRDQGKLDEAKTQLKIALERKLESQLLMPNDQRLLTEVRAVLAL
jgi:tetratricopeptide (TPR) repeat protein